MKIKYKPEHDKTNKMTFVACENSDEPGHPISLIRVFADRMMKPFNDCLSKSAQRRLISDWAESKADLSLRFFTMLHIIYKNEIYIIRSYS